jgi:FtsH-binding integral membrane protein
MAGCPNFLGWTYVHWLLAGIVSATTASLNPLGELGIDVRSFVAQIVLGLLLLVVTFAILAVPVGPLKYLLFVLLSVITGTFLIGVFERLEKKGLLVDVLITNCVIFIAMSVVGFYDTDNVVKFGPYLFAALIGMLVARLGLFVARSGTDTEKALGTLKQVDLFLSLASTGLFAIYVAYDTSMLKRMARTCEGKPDYINGAMGLYLDIVNLFVNTSSLVE